MNKRYYSLNTYFKGIYGRRVRKICIDAGFTCPNRDGKLSQKGCIFCDEKGSGADDISRKLPVWEQVNKYLETKARDNEYYLVYFQPFTNTYANIKILETLYKSVFLDKRIIGLSIGTRPDCLDEDKLMLIAEISGGREVWLELGLQSSNDRTLKRVNRGHNKEDFEKAVVASNKAGIKVCAHIILGLPGETPADYANTADFISSLPVKGLKIHHLYIAKNTEIERLYTGKEISLISKDTYIQEAASFLERTRPDIVIHRLMGDCRKERLVAPEWTLQKSEIVRDINKELAARNSWQGKKTRMAIVPRGTI
ncbi:MAG: TIGR01212 family radical SAM protein [Candidatus Aureabacteria bacterium]|nr:TIGR01212 family radical SAM protein [Candidatus Auribacterota bacterium]